MALGIPTSNIVQPGNISLTGGVTMSETMLRIIISFIRRRKAIITKQWNKSTKTKYPFSPIAGGMLLVHY